MCGHIAKLLVIIFSTSPAHQDSTMWSIKMVYSRIMVSHL